MPGKESKHTEKWDRCVKKVKDKSPDTNAYAICSSSIEDAGLKKNHQKRDKMEYYSNRKKSAKKNEMCITFESFDRFQQEDEQYWYKLKELTDRFLDEHDDVWSIGYIEEWLVDNNEPSDFASGIYDEINK